MPGKRRIRRIHHRTYRWIIAAAIVGVLLAGALIWYLIDAPYRRGPVLMPCSADATYAPFGKGLVYLDASGEAVFCKLTGREQWRVPAGGATRISAGRQVAALYGERGVTLLDANGKVLVEKAYEQAPQEVRCGNTCTAVLYGMPDGSARIDVLDGTGAQIDQITEKYLPAGITVVDLGFNGNNLWLLTLDTSGITPVSTITTFNPLAQLTTSSVRITGQVIYDVAFDDEVFFAIGTNHIVCYNYVGEEQRRQMIYGWQVCDTGKAEKQNVFLLTPLTDTETPHAPRNTAKMVLGDQVYTLTLAGEGYDSLLIGQKKVYALCQGTLTTYRIRDRKRADISLAFSAERASFAADGKTLLLASEGKLYAYLVR